MASERTASQGCPETYFCTPTPHVPNSPLPVLVYRSVLLSAPGRELSAETARATLEQNQWLQGGVFGHYPAHHYHSVTHECYAVFSGRSRFLLGKGPLDSSSDDDGKGNSSSSASSASSEGIEVDLAAGDIIVQPAGVAHCCLRSSEDFAYIGVYPKGSPHWDNNFCKAGPQETEDKARVARAVPLPEYDPVYGLDGPLVQLWNKAAATA